ncbi:MAG: phage/plasmid primase, P4 family [Thermanaerothrix sp.]|uniref:phage/plasmid primase, P4 family n=1 Tax=Thermanaerothrix sp. TaxID=2972675 RepID=UPI003C79AD32
MNTISITELVTYSLRGWRVFPVHSVQNGRCTCGNPNCQSPGKHPIGALVPRGFKDATIDLDQIAAWWMMQPEANVGIATGRESGLVVLDVDPRHDGGATLLDLEAKFGRLPATLEALSGGGGRHLYFKYPAGVQYLKSSVGALGPGLDIRADGGFVVAPPSIHISGNAYLWEASSDPENDEPADLPGWLLNLLTAGQSTPNGHKPQGQQAQGGKVLQGQRNTWLTSEAGRMRRAGMDEPAILAALRVLNQAQCQPPLDDAEVTRIAQSVCRYHPGYALSDAGSAEFFGDRHEKQICYRHDTRRWYVFRSPVWVTDDDGAVERLALEAIRERQAQAFGIQDADLRKKTMTFLLNSENGYRLRSMLEIAKSRPNLAKSGREFDQKPLLLAVKNGVIDLETGDFREGQPEDYLTQCAGTHYDPQAKAPRWEQFLRELFLDDQETITFIQRAVGYTLTGLTREQVFFFCHGARGLNGKSTLLDTLRAALGDYAKSTSFSTFTTDPNKGGHQESLMALEGARLVVAVETSTVGTLNEAVLKLVTGQDPVTGSRKHEHERTYMPQFKLWLAANDLPKVRDVSPAFWRRVVLIPFLARFEGQNQDKNLRAKLQAELPGILNWALEGCLAYQREGLNPPPQCVQAAEAWRADSDPLADFLATCKLDPRLETKASDLFAGYEQHCRLNGVPQAVKSIQLFSKLMVAHGFEREVRKNGKFFKGIGV